MSKKSMGVPGELHPVEMGGKPTHAFGSFYRKMSGLVDAQYPSEASWQWGRIVPGSKVQDIGRFPEDPAVFVKDLYMQSPSFEQEFIAELYSFMLELEANDWKLPNGMTLRPDQVADTASILFRMATGKRDAYASILLRKPPNGGKTIELGVLLAAFVRWQERQVAQDHDPMIGVYATAKKTHLMQQTLSGEQRVLLAPPYTIDRKTVLEYRRQFCMLFGQDEIDQYFPRAVWVELFEGGHTAGLNGMQIVCDSLRHRGMYQDFEEGGHYKRGSELLAMLAPLVGGEKRLITDISRMPVLIDPPPRPEGGEESALAYSGGDAMVGVPQGYRVLAGHTMLNGKEEPHANPRLILWPVSLFTGTTARKTMAEFIGRVRLVLADEAKRMSPLQFGQPVTGCGGDRPPVVIAAVAADGGMKGWGRSPVHSGIEGAERGYLLPVSYRMIGGGEYAKGTEEAWEQFMDAYFATSQLLTDLHQPQPCERNFLLAVPPKYTRECAHRIAERRILEGKPGRVLCYDGRTGGDAAREALELWFVHAEEDQKQLPHILVTSVSQLGTSIHFPNIGMVALLDDVSPENVAQFIGRGLHSTCHRAKGRHTKDYSVLCWQGCYAGMDARKLYPYIVDPHLAGDTTLPWVADQRLLPMSARRSDAQKTKGGSWASSRCVLPNPQAKPMRVQGVAGTPMELRAPILQRASEATLWFTPAMHITVADLMEFAHAYNPIASLYGPSLRRSAQEILQKCNGSLGYVAIGEMKRKVDHLAGRAVRLTGSRY